MKTKHTQGEWMAKEGQIYPCETGKTLAIIPYFDNENEEQQANEKLIAAAPEMLEALQSIVNKFDSVRKSVDADLINELSYAICVINKATHEN